MKVFVWSSVEKVSDRYHEGGGVVVFATDEARARALANAVEGCDIKDGEAPDVAVDAAASEERVFIMPDAGCC